MHGAPEIARSNSLPVRMQCACFMRQTSPAGTATTRKRPCAREASNDDVDQLPADARCRAITNSFINLDELEVSRKMHHGSVRSETDTRQSTSRAKKVGCN